MTRLEVRLDRLEQANPHVGMDHVTEIHRVIVKADRTPAMKADGTPWVIVRKIAAA